MTKLFVDQSYDDEDEIDKRMKDQYRHLHEENKAIEPLDLPSPPKESSERPEMMTPRREIRLSASTVDMPSSRTISTVTNPEYEPDPFSNIKQHRAPDHRGDSDSEKESEGDRGDEEDNRTGTDISRILSRALSQEHENDRAFASQYLESILNSGNRIDTRRAESPSDPENLSDSFHAPTSSSGNSQKEEESEGEGEEGEERDENENYPLAEEELEDELKTPTPPTDFNRNISNHLLKHLYPESDTPGAQSSFLDLAPSSYFSQATRKMM